MNEKIKNTIKIILFFAIGIILLWLVYKDEDPKELLKALRDANYWWIVFALFTSLLSHWSRAVRWNIMINAMGYKPRLANSFMSIMVMYLTNLAIPRSGEFTRCGIIKQYEKIPFTKLLGTVFIERIIDLIVLVLLLAFVLITQFTHIIDFFHENISSSLMDKLLAPKTLIILGSAFLLSLTALIVMRQKFKHSVIYKKISDFLKNFLEGVITIKNMDKKWWFIFHSIFIYIMYYLMIYLCFYAFDYTAHLGPVIGLTVFVLASLGMVAPSPGGIGTWHFMAIGTLFIYKVPELEAKAFAIATHGAQTLFLMIAGFICLTMLPIFNKKKLDIHLMQNE